MHNNSDLPRASRPSLGDSRNYSVMVSESSSEDTEEEGRALERELYDEEENAGLREGKKPGMKEWVMRSGSKGQNQSSTADATEKQPFVSSTPSTPTAPPSFFRRHLCLMIFGIVVIIIVVALAIWAATVQGGSSTTGSGNATTVLGNHTGIRTIAGIGSGVEQATNVVATQVKGAATLATAIAATLGSAVMRLPTQAPVALIEVKPSVSDSSSVPPTPTIQSGLGTDGSSPSPWTSSQVAYTRTTGGSLVSTPTGLPTAIAGQFYQGRGTWYQSDNHVTPCNVAPTDNDYVIALSSTLYQYGASNSSYSLYCGRQVTVTNLVNALTVNAWITDECADCIGVYGVDLSKTVFAALSPDEFSAGVLDVGWEFATSGSSYPSAIPGLTAPVPTPSAWVSQPPSEAYAAVARLGRRNASEWESHDLQRRDTNDATYFWQEGGRGSCENYSPDWGNHIVAMSGQWMSGDLCGRCITVHCTNSGRQITAKVQDTCPGCASGAIDLNAQAFVDLASDSWTDQGVLPVWWWWGGSC